MISLIPVVEILQHVLSEEKWLLKDVQECSSSSLSPSASLSYPSFALNQYVFDFPSVVIIVPPKGHFLRGKLHFL